MKKIAAALAALALLLSASCLAFRGEGYPAWDGMTVSPNSLSGALGEDSVTLEFDPSEEYSYVLDRTIQACFFAYDAAETNYLELHLLIPENILSGDFFRSSEGIACAIDLYETSVGAETLYSAAARASDGSSYEITLETVEFRDAAIAVSGKFTARLCRYEDDRPTQEFLDVREAHFSFELPRSAARSAPTQPPEDSFPALPDDPDSPGATFPALPSDPDSPGATFPALPDETEPPTFPGLEGEPRRGGAPAFTLPPDYAVL